MTLEPPKPATKHDFNYYSWLLRSSKKACEKLRAEGFDVPKEWESLP